MLRTIARRANFALAQRAPLSEIQPALCFAFRKENFSTTQVARYKQNLPQLPVPPLADTLQKYLKSVVPLLNECEYHRTCNLVHDFGKKGGCGEKLQGLLQEKAKCTQNWLEEWWLNTAYLGYRIPVVVHSSPGLVFPLKKFCSVEEKVMYTAKLIIACMKYKELIDNDKIPMEKMGKEELDMGQYKKFFGTCRIPKPKVDCLEFNPKSKHVIVAHNNHFFKLYPVSEKNQTLSLKQMMEHLNEILEKSCMKTEPVGILSSDHRDEWAKSYCLLTQDCENAKSVEEIQKSLFLVCMDGPMPDCPDSNQLTVAGGQCVHGGGSQANGGNRWFDKTVQFVIGCDGKVGLTYEHSPSEGQPIAVMTDFIVDNMDKIDSPGVPCGAKKPEHLKFNFTPELKAAIKRSSYNLDKLICDFDLQCHVFKCYGKNFIKSQKMSPDSYFQMAMQYAYYRMYQKPAPQYESGATRKFIGGRTETIRSCSVESMKFARAMMDQCIPPTEKRKLLTCAIDCHKKYTVDALSGLGVDRHFLGLQLIAKEKCIELPELFNDKGFTVSKHFRVSSSQVATKCPGFMCYGAVFPDGYGICYNPRDDDIYFGVGSFRADTTTCSAKMRDCLEECLKDMQDVLQQTQQAKL